MPSTVSSTGIIAVVIEIEWPSTCRAAIVNSTQRPDCSRASAAIQSERKIQPNSRKMISSVQGRRSRRSWKSASPSPLSTTWRPITRRRYSPGRRCSSRAKAFRASSSMSFTPEPEKAGASRNAVWRDRPAPSLPRIAVWRSASAIQAPSGGCRSQGSPGTGRGANRARASRSKSSMRMLGLPPMAAPKKRTSPRNTGSVTSRRGLVSARITRSSEPKVSRTSLSTARTSAPAGRSSMSLARIRSFSTRRTANTTAAARTSRPRQRRRRERQLMARRRPRPRGSRRRGTARPPRWARRWTRPERRG